MVKPFAQVLNHYELIQDPFVCDLFRKPCWVHENRLTCEKTETRSIWLTPRGDQLPFSNIPNFQHFCFLATVVGAPHIEGLVIVIDDFPDRAMLHIPATGFRVLASQRNRSPSTLAVPSIAKIPVPIESIHAVIYFLRRLS